MMIFRKNPLFRHAIFGLFIVLGQMPYAVMAGKPSSATRIVKAGSEGRAMLSVINNSDIARIESILRHKVLVGGTLLERVRLYAYYKTASRSVIVGVLALPDWRGKPFNPSFANSKDPLTWNVGSYLVLLSHLPSRVSVLPDTSCSLIPIEFDLETRSLNQSTCIQD